MAPLQNGELEKYSSEQRNGSSYGQFADRQLATLTTAFNLQFHDARHLMGGGKRESLMLLSAEAKQEK